MMLSSANLSRFSSCLLRSVVEVCRATTRRSYYSSVMRRPYGSGWLAIQIVDYVGVGQHDPLVFRKPEEPLVFVVRCHLGDIRLELQCERVDLFDEFRLQSRFRRCRLLDLLLELLSG